MDRKSHTAPLNGRCDHCLRSPPKLKFSGAPESSKHGWFVKKMMWHKWQKWHKIGKFMPFLPFMPVQIFIQAAFPILQAWQIHGGNAECVGSIIALNYERDMKNERRANWTCTRKSGIQSNIVKNLENSIKGSFFLQKFSTNHAARGGHLSKTTKNDPKIYLTTNYTQSDKPHHIGLPLLKSIYRRD